MAAAGIPSVLLTSPVADRASARASLRLPDRTRCRRRGRSSGAGALYADEAAPRRRKAERARRSRCRRSRTGIAPGEPALNWRSRSWRHRSLHVRRSAGILRPRIAHDAKRKVAPNTLRRALHAAPETRSNCSKQHGIEAPVDHRRQAAGAMQAMPRLPYVTELQAGSYALMDGAYARIGEH